MFDVVFIEFCIEFWFSGAVGDTSSGGHYGDVVEDRREEVLENIIFKIKKKIDTSIPVI